MPSCCGHELERQARRVEVQHVALTTPELRLREVAVGLDRARPLDVVEHLAPRDGRDRGDHGGRRRRLRDDARRRRRRAPRAPRRRGRRCCARARAAGGEHRAHVLGHAGAVAEREVEHDDVATAGRRARRAGSARRRCRRRPRTPRRGTRRGARVARPRDRRRSPRRPRSPRAAIGHRLGHPPSPLSAVLTR